MDLASIIVAVLALVSALAAAFVTGWLTLTLDEKKQRRATEAFAAK
jgi:type II secretory pathway pseudopilin PulG